MNKSIQPNSLTLKKMLREDVPRVHEIETLCFRSPWALESFYSELDNHLAIYHLAVYEEKVVGFCGIWLVVDEGHITNLAIDPVYQGRGFGKDMMKAVILWAKNNKICRLTLEVRVSNEKAIHLYHELGFVQAGLRKAYYEDTGEDAMIMWIQLNDQC